MATFVNVVLLFVVCFFTTISAQVSALFKPANKPNVIEFYPGNSAAPITIKLDDSFMFSKEFGKKMYRYRLLGFEALKGNSHKYRARIRVYKGDPKNNRWERKKVTFLSQKDFSKSMVKSKGILKIWTGTFSYYPAVEVEYGDEYVDEEDDGILFDGYYTDDERKQQQQQLNYLASFESEKRLIDNENYAFLIAVFSSVLPLIIIGSVLCGVVGVFIGCGLRVISKKYQFGGN